MTRNRIIILLLCCAVCRVAVAGGPDPDTVFLQPVSVKYYPDNTPGAGRLTKVLVDGDDNVHVLGDSGLYRISGRRLVKDLLYRPLAGKVPVDIALQDSTGSLYYLYEDRFLSNARAGTPFGMLPPGRFSRMAVAADGSVLLTGDHAAGIYRDGRLTEIAAPPEPLLDILVYKNEYYALSNNSVYRLSDKKLKALHHGKNLQAFAVRGKDILIGTAGGYYGISRVTGDTSLALQTRVPVPDIRRLMIAGGKCWAGTSRGAFMDDGPGRFRYYASERWLNDEAVEDLAADSRGNIYLLTGTALNEIRFIRQTLLQKAQYFQREIRKRHIRYGLLAELRLKTPGDLSTAEMIDTDNDGLWTAFYLGSQAFRYAVTGEEEAARYAWESFAAYERLISVTSVRGFPARTFERSGYKVSDPAAWRPSPDSGWEWKGTTSSDEFVGYIFVAALMDQFVAKTAAEKKRVADFIDKILTHIVAHNYYLVDADGQPTLWGRWNPEYINSYPETIGDRRLGSITLIAGLQLGYALTGRELYKKEATRLMDRYGYLRNILIDPYRIRATPGYTYRGHDMGNGHWNHSDDEMAFLSYWVLYRYAFTKALQRQYAGTIRRHWQIERPEKNPVWNLVTLATEGSFDKAATLWYLREFAMDRIRWTVKNSFRKDITLRQDPGFRNQYTEEVLPPGELPVARFNANAFNLDGGDGGRTALTGAEYLLPYWMARYLNVVEKGGER
ncbi:hypothetical protein [Compostibacter hankyongensis]|uniref:Uncharacterized protein n=1 Tax=Compostibacter hankyongensis TaxID=1007089 RepID=A0ABP8FN86_9BACT